MARGRRLTRHEEQEARKLRASGASLRTVARALGCSHRAIQNLEARGKAAASAKKPPVERPPLPEGANESDLAIRLEMRDALLERIRGELDHFELARLTRELNVTLDGIRRARAVPVAEEDFADEDAEWVLRKLRKLSGDEPNGDEPSQSTEGEEAKTA